MPGEAEGARWSAIGLGLTFTLCALLGLCYTGWSVWVALDGGFESVVTEFGATSFYEAFYSMVSVCSLFYVALLWCGFRFLRLRPPPARIVAALFILEVLYFLIEGFVGARLSGIGLSIAAATGVANGGLMVQFVILLPLWAPVVAFRMERRGLSS